MSDDEEVTPILEDPRDARIKAMEATLDRSEAAAAAKNAFLSSMSHELRTPLNAILGFAQLLQRDRREPLSERHLQRVEQILRSGEHLVRLLDDILDLSRIEADALSISIEPVDLRRVLEEVVEMLDEAAHRADVRVIIAPVAGGVPPVLADRTRLTQILLNLGSNAVKYNRPRGSVTFTISRPDAQSLRVTVTDTGMGIPVEHQSTLFRPFQRAGRQYGAIPGNGLGLALAKRLAELMNARIGFSSVPQQGSEFWIDTKTCARDESSAALDGVATSATDGDDGAKSACSARIESGPTCVEHPKRMTVRRAAPGHVPDTSWTASSERLLLRPAVAPLATLWHGTSMWKGAVAVCV
ncbi:MAG TPA: ATP-binding protein [Polyangiaceae bacterium]|nr:ATP-binding protein [Polyangiaceae bacterium]